MADVSHKSVGKIDYRRELQGLDTIYARIVGRLIDHTNEEIEKLRELSGGN